MSSNFLYNLVTPSIVWARKEKEEGKEIKKERKKEERKERQYCFPFSDTQHSDCPSLKQLAALIRFQLSCVSHKRHA
ncbi:hypothetical protein CMV_005139 [Castanea mollissima]|uniref:Uncharacterized protein n=1 Tax=Castanea mollissima TaxID=60419 RepID=A0A8J4W1T3_9ROSI|nr:hypothetical protein CMV_005139 [Castanea mollissima]